MFIIFFIPEAVLAIIGILALIGMLFLGENITNICWFCTNNFWIFIVLTIILVLVVTTLYAAEYDAISAIALVFASSQLLVLFLDTITGLNVLYVVKNKQHQKHIPVELQLVKSKELVKYANNHMEI